MLWRPGLNIYMHNAEILQNNYPEMQKRMFIINGSILCHCLHTSSGTSDIMWPVAFSYFSTKIIPNIVEAGTAYTKRRVQKED